MDIKKKDLRSCIFDKIGFHDSIIMSTKEENGNFTITFMDGFGPDQVNEITFINCNKKFDFKLEKREIYQIDDAYHFEGSKWNFSLLIWMKNNNLIEKVEFEADNAIIKVDINGKVYKEDLNKVFKIRS